MYSIGMQQALKQNKKQELKKHVIENVNKINQLSGTEYKLSYFSEVGYFIQDDVIGKRRFMHRKLEDVQSDLFDALDIIYHTYNKLGAN